MDFLELLLLAAGLSLDAFAVSICKGLAMKRATLRASLTCGAWFGGFQALMPLLGFWLAFWFAGAIRDFDHWIAFALLAIIGINMLKEAFSNEEECCNDDLGFKTMLVMAIATSIDAMAGGITIAMEEDANIWLAIALIGAITFGMSALGVKLGNAVGGKIEKKAQILGGVILIGLGIKILLEHLLEHAGVL